MMSLINSYAGNLDVVVERLMKFAVGIHSMSAQMEVTNSYQCLPFLLITTAMGEMS
jgi:hypothetical protein